MTYVDFVLTAQLKNKILGLKPVQFLSNSLYKFKFNRNFEWSSMFRQSSIAWLVMSQKQQQLFLNNAEFSRQTDKPNILRFLLFWGYFGQRYICKSYNANTRNLVGLVYYLTIENVNEGLIRFNESFFVTTSESRCSSVGRQILWEWFLSGHSCCEWFNWLKSARDNNGNSTIPICLELGKVSFDLEITILLCRGLKGTQWALEFSTIDNREWD